MAEDIYVMAIWDPDAESWFSDSNIVGLVIQTATLTEFEVLARHFAAELLAENMNVIGDTLIRFEAAAHFTVAALPFPLPAGEGGTHARQGRVRGYGAGRGETPRPPTRPGTRGPLLLPQGEAGRRPEMRVKSLG